MQKISHLFLVIYVPTVPLIPSYLLKRRNWKPSNLWKDMLLETLVIEFLSLGKVYQKMLNGDFKWLLLFFHLETLFNSDYLKDSED